MWVLLGPHDLEEPSHASDYDNRSGYREVGISDHGNDPTRENLMKEAASIHDLKLPMLLPGIVVSTSAQRAAHAADCGMLGRIQNACLRKWNATPTRMVSVKTITPKRPKKTRPMIRQAKSNVKTSNVATICHCSLEPSPGFPKILPRNHMTFPLVG